MLWSNDFDNVCIAIKIMSMSALPTTAPPRRDRVAYLIATRSGLYYGSCFERVLAAVNGSLPPAERLDRSDLYKVMRGAYRFNCHKGCTAARVPEKELASHPLWHSMALKTLVG